MDTPAYLSTPAAAALHGRSESYVYKLAAGGQIPGALLIGGRWLIPAGWTPPPKKHPGPQKRLQYVTAEPGADAAR